MHWNQISLPLTFYSIETYFFLMPQFIQPTYVLYIREKKENIPYTKMSAEEMPDSTDQKLSKLKCWLCVCTIHSSYTQRHCP